MRVRSRPRIFRAFAYVAVRHISDSWRSVAAHVQRGPGLIVAGSSVFPMLFGWAFARVAQRSLTLAYLAAPFLWVAQEFGRSKLPGIGFPWNLLGYAWSHSLAIAQLSTIGGVWLLSFLGAAFCSMVVWGIGERRSGKRGPILIAVVVTAGADSGHDFRRPMGSFCNSGSRCAVGAIQFSGAG